MITSTAHADGRLVVELVKSTMRDPGPNEVVIEIEAAPINPSDLGLLFGAADVANAEYSDRKIVASISQGVVASMGKRLGQAMPVGNEGAGRVVAAGDSEAAQALLGKRVACLAFGTYARYCIAPVGACMPLSDDINAEEGAAAFVNPLTALGFVETMKRDGAKAIIHTAAASNLGQMLLRICQEDGIDIVNIVRSDEQVALLRGLGAKHALNMKDDDYEAQLVAAIAETEAYVAFDPISGGNQLGRILNAMETVASRDEGFTPYGSNTMKRGYIYGLLDTGPVVIDRFFGFSWQVGGWLLFPFLQSAEPGMRERLQARIMAGLKTTFASHYSQRVTLREMLSRDAVMAYNARRTGEKFLVTPQG
ncbi:NADH oxidase [Croceicoccus naphthovorans]|uniref:NADH oxidase n=2 Tax=Croceicoccus naphthovorans TaxID=1348774 RepID=A0A0G3XLL3_9SPHN|nr:zinc-binding dehydrogenase [Croceicoccus naphthovorans]AKM11509.1 NADH oxidase [Croceicoccus naphthovorans]